MKGDNNYFDNLGSTFDPEEADKELKRRQTEAEKLDQLIHRVFVQTEPGQELLKVWQEALLITPTAVDGMDALSIGIAEGRKGFIRNIILTIRKVER